MEQPYKNKPACKVKPLDGEGKVKKVHWNLLLPLSLASETLDTLDGQMDGSVVDAQPNSQYDSEIEPDKYVAANAMAVACATIDLYMQNSYYVQKGRFGCNKMWLHSFQNQVGQL